MNRSLKQRAIGFPPPLLGADPLRLPVLADSEAWLALGKPAGVGLREYPWDPEVPNLDAALNQQLQAEKPELVRLGATTFGSIYYLEPEVSGVALFGKSREAIAALRNLYGSGHFACRFLFVARHQGEALGAERVSDAPLLPHNTKPKMIPSTAKGKKSATRFRLLAVSGSGWALWSAEMAFMRPHQARAHAAVLGLPVLGDVLYAGPEVPSLRDLQPKKRGPGVLAPVFEGVALHLAEVVIPDSDCFEAGVVCAPLPRRFEVLLQRVGLALPAGCFGGGVGGV